MGNETSPSDQQAETSQAPRLSVECCAHAYDCKDSKCTRPFCSRIKRVLQHKMTCNRKTKGGCVICREINALCFDHVRHCKDDKCLAPAPFCLNLKKKIKRQRKHLRRLSALKGRFSYTSTRNIHPSSGQGSQSSHELKMKTLEGCGKAFDSGPNKDEFKALACDLTTSTNVVCQAHPQNSAAAKINITRYKCAEAHENGQEHGSVEIASTIQRVATEKNSFYQLLEALEAPQSEEQQLRILNILQKNPLLVKEYLMFRLCQAKHKLANLQAQKAYLLSLNVTNC